MPPKKKGKKKEVPPPVVDEGPIRVPDIIDDTQQLYLLEIFIDQIQIFLPENEDIGTANKNYIVHASFSPEHQVILYEGTQSKSDNITVDEQGRKTFTRDMRVGKSVLITSSPNRMAALLYNNPLDLVLWNDDSNEVDEKIYVGCGREYWVKKCFHYLNESVILCEIYKSRSVKQITPIFAECCCVECAKIASIIRFTALGDMVITEFKQDHAQQESCLFKVNKVDSAYDCKKVLPTDYPMTGDTYGPYFTYEVIPPKKIDVCTELQSCGIIGVSKEPIVCKGEGSVPKEYPTKIKMGDIVGPCGNPSCALSHKIKNYIRNMDAYKKVAGERDVKKDIANEKRVCGSCSCKDDYIYQTCPPLSKQINALGTCKQCGGAAPPGFSCEYLREKFYATGVTPKSSALYPPCNMGRSGSDTVINYMIGITKDQQQSSKATFGRDFIVNYNYDNIREGPRHHTNAIGMSKFERKSLVYNVTDIKPSTDCDKAATSTECPCYPPRPNAPCGALDCACISKAREETSRKQHKPYCPLYLHKVTCPVTLMKNAEENAAKEEGAATEEKDIVEPTAVVDELPYGLSPVKLGPCPVMGRPCTVPDGFARMYKVEALEKAPLSYSEAGKICCTKEFDRIKAAMDEYINDKETRDKRCVNKFNVDTERRCCDTMQKIKIISGKTCCGPHVLGDKKSY